MVTFRDLAKPYEEMSDETKAVFMRAFELAKKDQEELLKKAKEKNETENHNYNANL